MDMAVKMTITSKCSKIQKISITYTTYNKNSVFIHLLSDDNSLCICGVKRAFRENASLLISKEFFGQSLWPEDWVNLCDSEKLPELMSLYPCIFLGWNTCINCINLEKLLIPALGFVNGLWNPGGVPLPVDTKTKIVPAGTSSTLQRPHSTVACTFLYSTP